MVQQISKHCSDLESNTPLTAQQATALTVQLLDLERDLTCLHFHRYVGGLY